MWSDKEERDMTLQKAKICRLCGASFVVEFKNQMYCMDCLSHVDLKMKGDHNIQFALREEEIELLNQLKGGKNKEE